MENPTEIINWVDFDQYLRAQTKCEGKSKIDIDIKKDKTHVTISLRVTPWLKFV